jgi:tetratricopeptide (TPR) repeat protein
MKMRYDFAPQTPVQIELYSDRSHFSVRTSGLPNIGIQGVCFGHVVASMSPKSEPFNWGNVLWHELGHVFAIQQSKNHVPRWFTEGLSEYETIVRRPEWRRAHDPDLYDALTRNILPGAVDMNKAFTHASEIDTTVAYYAASQMIIFTAERFGFAKIVEALKLWGDGVRTADVIQKAFNVSPKEYDDGFRAWEMQRLARYNGQFNFNPKPKPLDEAKAAVTASPNSAAAHVDYAMALLRAHKLEDAQHEIDEALRLDPNDKNAHYLAYKMVKSDLAKKEEHLRAIQKAGGDGYAVQLAFGDIAQDRKDKAGMRAAFVRANHFDPTQSEPLKALYDLAKEQHDDAGMVDALRKLAPLEQHDPRIWRMLLEKLVATKTWDEAKRVGEGALFVDIHGAPTHILYARALAATGANAKAMFELFSALLCNGIKKNEAASAHALLARLFTAQGDKAEAQKHLDEAKGLDPQNADLQGAAP